LRLATDLSAWWDTFGAELQPDALDGLLRAYPALAHVIPASVKVAEILVGLPTSKAIRNMPKLDLRDRVAVWLANPNPHGSVPQLHAEMGLIDGLLIPSGGFGAFVRRQLLLPREILDEHDRRASKPRLRASLGDTGRGLVRFGVLIRYGFAIVRLGRTFGTSLRSSLPWNRRRLQ
jgi:hypothetical protein